MPSRPLPKARVIRGANNRLAGSEPDWERRRHIIALKAQGLSFAEIGRQLGCSRPSVHEVYWTAMREIANEHKEEATVAFSHCYTLEMETIYEARKIRDMVCQRCYGQQRVEAQDSEVWGADGDGRILCPHCKGSGYQYEPTTRLTASMVVQKSAEHLGRIWGLEKLAGQMEAQRYEFSDDVLQMSNEDIEREYQAMMSPINASERAWENAKR